MSDHFLNNIIEAIGVITSTYSLGEANVSVKFVGPFMLASYIFI